jgi:chemotaxis signal transduction protein
MGNCGARVIAMAESYELLMTTLEGRYYAIPVELVIEVIGAVEASPFIDRAPSILGLINVRGDIVPVHSLRCYLGLEEKEMVDTDQMVILAADQSLKTKVAVLVDRVDTVQTFQEEQLFAQSLSPNAFKIVGVANKKVLLGEIREFLES